MAGTQRGTSQHERTIRENARNTTPQRSEIPHRGGEATHENRACCEVSTPSGRSVSPRTAP